jgi:PAS domain S-box-containing protein
MKPTTLLVRTLSITVAAELAILLGFDLMRVEPGIAAAIFNAVILSALTAPLLYSFVFRAAQREVKVLGDATGFTEAQHALEQSEKRFRTLMEKIPDGLGVLSRDGRIIYANPAVSTMLGYSTAELRGKRVRELQHPEDRERAARRTQELFRDSAEYPSEYRLLHLNGTAIPVEMSSRVIEYDGEPALLATMRDLTERRQLEDQLRQSQKMEAVGQLAGGIAHDFNNLLTVIQTSSELVADSLPARIPELAADVAEIRAAVERGKSLIQQLLAFSRRGELSFEPIDIGQLVRAFEPTLLRLLPDDIEIQLDIPDDTRSAHGNRSSLEQIIMNLATNSSHAMPNGGVLSIDVREVRLTIEDTTEQMPVTAGAFICLGVADTGVGMDERTREKLFEPFFTTRSMGGGTGLGTAVVYGLAKQHGGTIRVDSEPGKGTRVEVFLPVATQSAPVASAEIEQEQKPEKHGGSETILVAEDEPALRRAAQRSLQRLGYRVILAADGAEAIELFDQVGDQVDLILTDIVMPRIGGRALYDTLRRRGIRTKFLFASGYTAGDVQENEWMEPDFPFLPKPWTIEELAQKVREVLDQD